jgi:hypothetical protein
MLWFLVFLFACGEWLIIFKPDLRSSLSFLRQSPQSFSCTDLPKEAALLFFNFKVWVVVALAQAIGWGVVAYVSLRWLAELWRTGEVAGRWRRVGTIVIRCLLFGLGLWFFLTPPPSWHMECFTGHVAVEASGVLAYVAVGCATIVMWVLESRVCALPEAEGRLANTCSYLELRHKLQTLLSMASLVLAFGVIGLMTRRAFLQPISPDSFFSGSIVLEGFEYTVLLALAYAPVHAAFNTVGIKLRKSLIPAAPTNDSIEALQSWASLSSNLGELLQISVYDWKTFGPGFPILAPFLLSLLSGLIKR